MGAQFTVRRALFFVGVALVCVAFVRLVGGSGASAPSGPEPVDLSVADQHTSDAQIVVDARGTAIALWHRISSSDSIVQSAVRPAGGPWQAPTDVSAGGQHASSPQLAVDARGTAVAVWERLKDGNYVVQAAVRPAGGSWGAVVNLSAPGRECRPGPACRSVVAERVVRPLLPRVVIDRRGNAAAIWERFQGRSSRVQAAVRPVGGRWRQAADVVRFGRVRSQDFAAPQIALGRHGEAIAAWTRTRATGSVVQAAVRRARGAWRAPVDVSTVGRSGGAAQIALDPRGNAHAIWQLTPRGTDDETTVVQSATRASNGRWTKPVDLSAAGAHASDPKLAVDQRGRAVAVWSRSTRDTAIVQSATRAGAGTWQRPVDITVAAPETYAGGADLALDARGNAVAAWHLTLPHPTGQDEEPAVIVQGAARPTSGRWQPRSLRGADNVRGAVRVAIDPHGEMAAIWQRLGPRGYIVVRATVP